MLYKYYDNDDHNNNNNKARTISDPSQGTTDKLEVTVIIRHGYESKVLFHAVGWDTCCRVLVVCIQVVYLQWLCPLSGILIHSRLSILSPYFDHQLASVSSEISEKSNYINKNKWTLRQCDCSCKYLIVFI